MENVSSYPMAKVSDDLTVKSDDLDRGLNQARSDHNMTTVSEILLTARTTIKSTIIKKTFETGGALVVGHNNRAYNLKNVTRPSGLRNVGPRGGGIFQDSIKVGPTYYNCTTKPCRYVQPGLDSATLVVGGISLGLLMALFCFCLENRRAQLAAKALTKLNEAIILDECCMERVVPILTPLPHDFDFRQTCDCHFINEGSSLEVDSFRLMRRERRRTTSSAMRSVRNMLSFPTAVTMQRYMSFLLSEAKQEKKEKIERQIKTFTITSDV